MGVETEVELDEEGEGRRESKDCDGCRNVNKREYKSVSGCYFLYDEVSNCL